MSGREIARILHGSHLFGTATEKSDMDYKSVVLPSAREILLGKVDVSLCDTGDNAPNQAGDVDDERHDLMRFTRLLAAGQPVAIELLFAPRDFHQFEPDEIWTEMQCNSDRIVSREAGKFLGYCRRQALVYGLKGKRVEAAEKTLALLDEAIRIHGYRDKLAAHIGDVIASVGSDHVRVETRTMQTGREIAHLRIAGKMAAETVTLAEARDIAASVVKDYGERARKAKESSGKDWKALSHALRIGYEAVELFQTGALTLPRPEAKRLLDVKTGRLDANEVGDEIVELLEKVESAAADSPLRDGADMEYLNGLVMSAHRDVVVSDLSPEYPAMIGA